MGTDFNGQYYLMRAALYGARKASPEWVEHLNRFPSRTTHFRHCPPSENFLKVSCRAVTNLDTTRLLRQVGSIDTVPSIIRRVGSSIILCIIRKHIPKLFGVPDGFHHDKPIKVEYL